MFNVSSSNSARTNGTTDTACSPKVATLIKLTKINFRLLKIDSESVTRLI